MQFNEELKVKQAAAVTFLRQSTKKYLTREIEKDLDMTIDYTVGAWEKLIWPQKLWTILTKLQVLKENPDTAKTQNSFRTSLWNMYLAPTFDPSNKIDGNQAVLKAIVSEVLKVLLSPYLDKESKAELLQDIQKMFTLNHAQESQIMPTTLITEKIIDPF